MSGGHQESEQLLFSGGEGEGEEKKKCQQILFLPKKKYR